jgi:hypothetical protein
VSTTPRTIRVWYPNESGCLESKSYRAAGWKIIDHHVVLYNSDRTTVAEFASWHHVEVVEGEQPKWDPRSDLQFNTPIPGTS